MPNLRFNGQMNVVIFTCPIFYNISDGCKIVNTCLSGREADMPVDLLTTEQELNYGRYVAEPNDVQLARYFHLDERDLAFINQRRGRHNRLGIALQLTSARFLGTFLTDLTRILPGVQQFVAVQLNIRRPEVLSRYAERETTLREHTALIKEYYGYHEFGDFPWSFRLKRLLYTRAWLSNERPGLMFDFATAWLLQNKVLLPGATTLVRLVSEIRERANQRLWKKLAALPDSWQTARVTELLDIPEGQRISPLEQLKKGPVTVSGPAFTEALERYIRLRNLEFSRLNLLLEIDSRTGFTREFMHVSESGARAQDLHVSLCAVLMAEACNIGLEPLIKHNIPALTRHRLSWVKQNYLRAETLVSANARLVDFQSTLELAGHWGGGEVASADGMRFVTPVKSVNSGPNRKYFGSGRASPGTTSSLISTLDFTVLWYPAHCGIPFLCWKAFWSSRQG